MKYDKLPYSYAVIIMSYIKKYLNFFYHMIFFRKLWYFFFNFSLDSFNLVYTHVEAELFYHVDVQFDTAT